jgi:hypothetical protein
MRVECLRHGLQGGIQVSRDVYDYIVSGGERPEALEVKYIFKDDDNFPWEIFVSKNFAMQKGIQDTRVIQIENDDELPNWDSELSVICLQCLKNAFGENIIDL